MDQQRKILRLPLIVMILAVISVLPTTELRPDDPDKPASPTADSMVGKEPGQVREDNGLEMKLVWCPPGSVTMEQVELIWAEEKNIGDRPIRRNIIPVKAFVTRGYWLGKCEVTQSEWKLVMKTEPWKGQGRTEEGADYPATYISWNDATEFCRELTDQERQAGRLPNDWGYTLPTEAQWERACRARTETKFSFGDDESNLGDYAWFEGNALRADELYAHRVGQKKPNQWGLCDMHGNVWEWCRDIYSGQLPGGRDPEVIADAKTKGSNRVYRGGSWSNDAAVCRSGFRDRTQPGNRNYYYGFRPALCSVQPVK
jgi:formylglycine-generating enzyme required for sulfatase activity